VVASVEEAVEVVAVVDASSVGTIEGLASMRMVRVDVAVRPF
jgi:hypothetical protein